MNRVPLPRRSWVILTAVIGLSALSVLALKPVPNLQNADTILTVGQLETISSPCCGDVQIRLVDDPRTYYINRGLEAGLQLAHLRQRLDGQTVQMRVAKRSWSPLDPLHRKIPVAHLECSGEVFFSASE